MSQDGKCPRVANVPGRQMSRMANVMAGKSQKANIPFFGCWLKVAFVQGRQMSRAANVPGWQMESGKCPKIEIKAIVL